MEKGNLEPGDRRLAPCGGWESDFAQALARLEANRLARRDLDLDAGLRIATDAAFAIPDLEDPEAAELDASLVEKRLLHRLQDCRDGIGRLHPRYVDSLRHAVDDICLDHEHSEARRSVAVPSR